MIPTGILDGSFAMRISIHGPGAGTSDKSPTRNRRLIARTASLRNGVAGAPPSVGRSTTGLARVPEPTAAPHRVRQLRDLFELRDDHRRDHQLGDAVSGLHDERLRPEVD